MKTQRIKFVLPSLLLISALLVSCWSKDDNVEPEQMLLPTNVSVEIDAIIVNINRTFMTSTIEGGDRNIPFTIRTEAQEDSYTMNESEADRTNSRPAKGNVMSCIGGLELSDEQRLNIRRMIHNNNECVQTNMKGYRIEISELNRKMESSRKDLISKLEAGSITEEEFRRSLYSLRVRFAESLVNIKRKHALELNKCAAQFLRRLHTVLSDEQWAEFASCARS
jgi:hypothetical protein